MAKINTQFVCNSCGAVFSKWQGKCDQCNSWNTLIEQVVATTAKNKKAAPNPAALVNSVLPLKKSLQLNASFRRFSTAIGELDRCLGTDDAGKMGLVAGSVILIGGEPGIGKSTLLSQVVVHWSESIMYICGEESPQQINLRLRRLLKDEQKLGNLLFDYVTTTDVDEITTIIGERKPTLLIVDSVQTLSTNDLAGQAGSLGQIKECTDRIVRTVKPLNIPTFLVGHVTKDGEIAGPKVLEHMVDAIFELTGERSGELRFLRTLKNRFGPTDEVGVFRMAETGMEEVNNPSEYFLQSAQTKIPGSGVVCLLEGTRPLLTEVQALVVPSQLAMPRRVGRGIDLSRVQVLAAVLQKHCGLPLGLNDIFLSVVGGMKVTEAGIDLGLAVALASSLTGKPLPERTIFIGEVGLMGEIRPVAALERREKEAKRLGYTKIYSYKTHRTVKQLLKELETN